ncbi:Imm1 family immunity protein [Kitasatospora sp. NPDC088351]|uniref:Imm1 family immunity protein n=1 Tax=Kitasatospora sp. NPDC088351 TaxID=3155180 RepID=UPI00343CC0C2
MAMRAEVRYRREHMDSPRHLEMVEDVDSLINELLFGPKNENLAQIIHLSRERVAFGWPDHELVVGVDKELNVGLMSFMDRTENYVTAGPENSRNAPEYYLAGHWRSFPDQTEVSIDLVCEAVKEFLLSGGQRPVCVKWKE